jgi:hypothetical protein
MKAESSIPFRNNAPNQSQPVTSDDISKLTPSHIRVIQGNGSSSPAKAANTNGAPEFVEGSRGRNGRSTRQLHLWITERDFRFLQQLAGEEEEPVAKIVRRLIRQLRKSSDGCLKAP